MRRFIAAIIDSVICYIVGTIGFICFVSGLAEIRHNFTVGHNKQWFVILMLVYLFSVLLIIYCYSYLIDYRFKGITIGKKMIGAEIYIEQNDEEMINQKEWALRHSLVRVLASFLYPVTIVFYIWTGQMPYDRWLKLTVR